MADYEIEIFRRVYDNKNHAAITVGSSGDFPGNVVLYTEEMSKGREHFGMLWLDLPAEHMRQIGLALIAAADEVAFEVINK